MPEAILRLKYLWAALGVGRSKGYEHFVLHDEDDPYIPGTRVKRTRLVRMGPRMVGGRQSEAERIIREMAAIPYRPQPVKRREAAPAPIERRRPRVRSVNRASAR